MKVEEIAEEIANKRCHEIMCYGHCSFNSPKHHRCGEWHREYNCALEGFKAGRPQWHDLRKDPNDLPNGGRIVSDQEGNNVIYVERLNTWIYRHRTCKANVIAWCENPSFKEIKEN